MNKLVNTEYASGRKEQDKQENLKVLFTLMALGHKSDRAISKILGINNTTLSRRRRKLEEEGYIKEYTIIPDFHKLGLDVLVFTYASTTEAVNPAQPAEFQALIDKYPQILCVLEDQGIAGRSWFIVSAHKSYDDYLEIFNAAQEESLVMKHRPSHVELHTFVYRTSKPIPKYFSMRNLEGILNPKDHRNALGKKN